MCSSSDFLAGQLLRLVERTGLVVGAGIAVVATFEQALDPTGDRLRDGEDIVVGQWWERMKRHRVVDVLLPHALGYDPRSLIG